jgi:23S rRNA (guanine2445-N2)-methyltransferase / 23S rRNA (guanine2069-N7)-methyltransferase
MSSAPHAFFATVPRGLAELLASELEALGIAAPRAGPAGVAFRGTLEDAYRACLWARTASRVLLPLGEAGAGSGDELYQGASELGWEDHVPVHATFAVEVAGSAEGISNTLYAVQRVKDAVVDRLRARVGARPSVDLHNPDLRIHLHLRGARATLSLDLSGESLHRRGYRAEGVAAPLKENLAAGILLRAGWPGLAAAGGSLLDPLCGSGTLPIEGALIAADVAPGLTRARFGFTAWPGHDPGAWEHLVTEARARARAGLDRLPPVAGFDHDPRAIAAARANARAAGLEGRIHLARRALADLAPLAGTEGRSGLVVANPPYGERLDAEEGLAELYRTLGERLRSHFEGWQAAVFTGNPGLARHLGLRVARRHTLWNGPIPCQLLRCRIGTGVAATARVATAQGPATARMEAPHLPGEGEAARGAAAEVREGAAVRPADSALQGLSGSAVMLANRLRKNLASLGRWARREGVECFRLYDADLPEYAVAVDLYQGAERHVHVQEYAPPPTVDAEAARRRLAEVRRILPALLEVPGNRVHLKVRRRQRGGSQYERLGERGTEIAVREGDCRYLVNLTDYLDTGLFLDHRETRRRLAAMAGGHDFLNLFAYTGTATVCAARGGARSTTSVDLSATYLAWARRNLALNGLTGPEHRLIQADCAEWLAEQASRGPGGPRYGLIFLDPPTFSRSKRMAGTLDVQRDHVGLVRHCAALLAPGGVLVFSTNLRSFRMDRPALADLALENVSARTLPRDFARNPRIHQCWEVRTRAAAGGG